jgi:hypothetical protein
MRAHKGSGRDRGRRERHRREVIHTQAMGRTGDSPHWHRPCIRHPEAQPRIGTQRRGDELPVEHLMGSAIVATGHTHPPSGGADDLVNPHVGRQTLLYLILIPRYRDENMRTMCSDPGGVRNHLLEVALVAFEIGKGWR